MANRVCVSILVVVVMMTMPSARAAQHDAHPGDAEAASASGAVAQCTQVQPAITATIAVALKRLDDARQSNSAAAMRAAADDLQAMLLDIGSRLAPCSRMQVTSADPHAGHTMPQPPPASPARSPESSAPQPAPAAPVHQH
jgi:hypothetical protein